MKAQVLGYKHSKGDFNGQAYDYVTVFTIAKLQRKDTQVGYAGIEMRGEPVLLEKLRKIEFTGPILCEIETETIATGKGQFSEFVVNVLPIKQGA